jgi:hypothetical protein
MPRGTGWSRTYIHSYAFFSIRDDVFIGLKIQICEEIPLLFHMVNEWFFCLPKLALVGFKFQIF